MRSRRQELVVLLVLAFRLEHSACAVPPLSHDTRQDMASNIMIGRVGATTVKLVEKKRDGDFIDAIHTARFEIISVEKGSGVSTISWWVPHHRPSVWSGHQGQNEHPPTDQVIRVFATAAGELLAPNGWEVYQDKDESELMPEPESPEEVESQAHVEPPEVEVEDDEAVPPLIDEEADAASVVESEEELEVVEEDEEPQADPGTHATPDAEQPPSSTETLAVQRSIARPWRTLFLQFARLKQAIRNLFRRKFRVVASDTEL